MDVKTKHRKAPVHTAVEIAVPHRISGFFEIVDQWQQGRPDVSSLDGLSALGSRGGGPCLADCGRTRIEVKTRVAGEDQVKIYINGQDRTTEAKTTRSVLKWFPLELDRGVALDIFHDFPLLSGAGYGSSGCGAIGTSIGLNLLFNTGFSLNTCGQFAHCAEVENKTGLGTVGGQIAGGCTITIEPGYPFKLFKMIIPPHYKIACASQGGILTSSILGDQTIRENITRAGRKSMRDIIKDFTIQNYMKISREFVTCTGMLDIPELDLGGVKNIMSIINENIDENLLGASMNQLGKSVFCIYHENGTVKEKIKEIFEENDFPRVKFLDFNVSGPKVLRLERASF
ncbi:MAG: hypothetical protein ACTSUE_08435 [Promethearchaeota archaeon]